MCDVCCYIVDSFDDVVCCGIGDCCFGSVEIVCGLIVCCSFDGFGYCCIVIGWYGLWCDCISVYICFEYCFCYCCCFICWYNWYCVCFVDVIGCIGIVCYFCCVGIVGWCYGYDLWFVFLCFDVCIDCCVCCDGIDDWCVGFDVWFDCVDVGCIGVCYCDVCDFYVCVECCIVFCVGIDVFCQYGDYVDWYNDYDFCYIWFIWCSYFVVVNQFVGVVYCVYYDVGVFQCVCFGYYGCCYFGLFVCGCVFSCSCNLDVYDIVCFCCFVGRLDYVV